MYNKSKHLISQCVTQNSRLYFLICIVYFLISFNSKILRNLKESVLLTIPDGGAILIPFVKLYLMLPIAIAAIALFNWLSNRYSQKKVFTALIVLFCSWFLVFALLIYPSRDVLALSHSGMIIQHFLPDMFAPLAHLVTHWGPTFFYISAELWPNLLISFLLWSFISDITTTKQATVLFPILGLDITGLSAGVVCSWLSGMAGGWEVSLAVAILLICVTSTIALIVFWRLVPERQPTSTTAPKFSIWQSLNVLRGNSILLYAASSLLVYQVTIGLAEVVWKDRTLMVYPNASGYSAFLGLVAVGTGIAGVICSLFILPKLLQRCSWNFNAFISPCILMVSSLVFFASIFYSRYLTSLNEWFIFLPLFVGAVHMALTDILKYTFVDATKELAVQQLHADIRRQGKSIVDVLGSSCGVALGPIICQILLFIGLTTEGFAVVLACITTVLFAWWIASSAMVRSVEKAEGTTT